MEFEEILIRFRALGGIADNLTLRHGEFGRGLFTVNPKKAFRLCVPASLLVDPAWVELDSKEQLRIRPQSSSISEDAVAFFELYQRHFGWGDGGKDSVAQHQRDLQALPPKLKNFLHVLGAADELKQKPTTSYCLNRYFVNRQIGTKAGSGLMPIAELINHSQEGLPYLVDDGVTVTGMVKDEILTRYHSGLDSFHFFINYHFATPAHTALSCEVTVEVPEFGPIAIKRMDHLANVNGTVRTPIASRTEGKLTLSFVALANQKNPSQPRKTFVELMKVNGMPKAVANNLFDGLLEHNRQVLSELIQECGLHSGTMTGTLNKVAGFQLASLT